MSPHRNTAFALAWMVLIFILSSIPGSYTGPEGGMFDFLKKVLHFCIFGVLAYSYFRALEGARFFVGRWRAAILASFILATLYAISDEYHQLFTPGRHASPYDVLIDSAGSAVFLAVLYVKRRSTELPKQG
jgi:VanZ family protein